MAVLHRIKVMPANSAVIVTLTLLCLDNVLKIRCRNIDFYDDHSDDTVISRHVPYSYKAALPSELAVNRQPNPNRLETSNEPFDAKLDDSYNVIDEQRQAADDTVNDILENVVREFVKFDNADRFLSEIGASQIQSKDIRDIVLKGNDEHQNLNSLEINKKLKDNEQTETDNTRYLSEDSNRKADRTNMDKTKRGRMDPDMCETEQIEIDLQFKEHVSTDTSSSLLICAGKVIVNKCEGLCNSNVSPSVNHYDGFQRVSFLTRSKLS